MEKKISRLSIIIGVIVMLTGIIGGVHTCGSPSNGRALHDTALISTLEKDNKALQEKYTKSLARLQSKQDSLLLAFYEKSQQLQEMRVKSTAIEKKLNGQLDFAEESGTLPDSLVAYTRNFIEAQHQKDSACTHTIQALENTVEVKDSVCLTQNLLILNLEQAVKLKEYKEQDLTAHLEAITKEADKKKKQNKWLGRGLCIVSGIAASLLILQATK